MTKSTKITEDEWVNEMFKLPEQRPKGWFTVQEISEKTKTNKRTVAYRIAQYVLNGQLEVMECLENSKRAKCYKKKKNCKADFM